MSPRGLAGAVAAGRVGIGAAMLVAPARFGRPWLGSAAETGGGGVAVRALGARDLTVGALGVAALAGRLGTPATAATIVAAGAGCDLADGVALVIARRDVPAAGLATGVFALGAAVLGGVLAQRLRSA